jgi:signal transduction histidine kinase/ActR/RegA family two-component response regulator
MNFPDKSDLVEAKRSQNLERYAAQIERLDREIIAAQANQSLSAEAIAHECAAEFYLEWGKEKIAAVYLQDAYNCYLKSGADAEIEHLEQSYPQLLKPILPQRQQFGGTNYFTDEFVATISHEFRNPLNGILGMSEALLEEVFGTMNERQLNAVSTIDRSGGYLLALINNMADLSQIQAGKLELEITDVSVAELCQSSATFVKHHAIQKQIQLNLDVPTDVENIAVDFQRMRQVFINLLSHAIDSTPVGGKVKLVVTKNPVATTTNSTASIEFAVIDTSKEIPAVSEDNSARSFPQIDHRRTGLGLMLVHPIVELHGGTLSYQSNIGRGSCVNVSLPDTCSISDLPTDLDDSVDYLGSISETLAEEISEPPLILIVEDNELNINTISSYLSAKGYHPIVASDGQSAIELTQKHHPDLILMDIQMPGMDGLEAISRIRQNPQLAEIPIVALTALAMEGDREKCLKAGANDYLTKPVKLKQLNTTIQQFLVPKIDNTSVSSDLWS